jgi:phosphopentomutase
MKRTFIMVLDSFGIGASEDAERFGDVGSDTLGHIADACARGEADIGRKGPLTLPNLSRLGLGKRQKNLRGVSRRDWIKTPKSSAHMAMLASFLPVKIPVWPLGNRWCSGSVRLGLLLRS